MGSAQVPADYAPRQLYAEDVAALLKGIGTPIPARSALGARLYPDQRGGGGSQAPRGWGGERGGKALRVV